MRKFRMDILPKVAIAFVLVFFPFLFLLEYAAGRMFEAQAIENANRALRIYTVNEGRSLDRLFDGYANLGRKTSSFIQEALSKPLPEEMLADFDRSHKLVNGAVRTNLEASPDKDIPGVFISSLAKVDDELKRQVVASGKGILPYSKAANHDVFDTYFIAARHFLRIYPKDWALEIEADHDFRKDAFFYMGDPEHDPRRLPVWTPPYYDSIIKHWMVSVLTPVYVGDSFMGVAGHDVILDRIYKDVIDKRIFSSGYSFIFDSKQNVVVHPGYLDQLAKSAAMGAELNFSSLKERGLAEMISKAVSSDASPGSYLHYSFQEGGRSYFFYACRLKFLNWYFASVVPQDELAGMLPQFMKRLLAGATLCGIFVFCLVILILWAYVLSPLKRISAATKIIGEGGLDHEVEVRSGDELGRLAGSFNSMVARLRERDAQLGARGEELAKANAELTAHRENLQRLVEAQTEELKKQNRQLEDRMEAYLLLVADMKAKLDTVGDAIRVIDKDCQVIYANRSFLELCGLQREGDAVGKPCHEVFPGEVCGTEACPIKRIMMGEKEFEIDVRRRVPDGEERTFILSVRPYYAADGSVTGIMEIFKDITERSKLQELAERNAQHQGRIEMSNNVLHDIGNALTGIAANVLNPQLQKEWQELKSLQQLKGLFISEKGSLGPALGEERYGKLIGFVEALTASLEKRSASYADFSKKVSRAVGHICSVLDLQRRYVREKATPLASDVNIKALLEDALAMLSSGQERRGIQVSMSFKGGSAFVSGDQTRLIRVFLNILKNAYEAFDSSTSEGARTLSIEVAASPENGELSISFTDNASGFPPEVGANLFKRGFTTKERGSGIGLHECRSIIESHGGAISIASEGEGKGASATIRLPLLKNRKG